MANSLVAQNYRLMFELKGYVNNLFVYCEDTNKSALSITHCMGPSNQFYQWSNEKTAYFLGPSIV